MAVPVHEAGAERLAVLPELTTDISFRFLVFEKE